MLFAVEGVDHFNLIANFCVSDGRKLTSAKPTRSASVWRCLSPSPTRKGILVLGHDISLNVLFSFAESLENHIQAAEATHHN
jgi:hypothetical protein